MEYRWSYWLGLNFGKLESCRNKLVFGIIMNVNVCLLCWFKFIIIVEVWCFVFSVMVWVLIFFCCKICCIKWLKLFCLICLINVFLFFNLVIFIVILVGVLSGYLR